MSARYAPQDITEATRRLDVAMSRLTGALAREAGVSVPELLALEHLAAGGGMGPSELARRLQLSTGSVTSLIDRLEADGRAVRTPHPSDRRRVVVRGTSKAYADLRHEWAGLAESITQAAASLGDDERQAVGGFLDRLTEIVQRAADEACAA